MWTKHSNLFEDWRVKVVYEGDRAVHKGNCHRDIDEKTFVVQLGFNEEEWSGLFFSVKDLPYIEEHELSHAFGLIDGTEEFCMNPIFAYPHELPEIYRAYMRNEKRAWLSQLERYLPLEMLEKIQLFLTDYLVSLSKKEDRFSFSLPEGATQR